MFETGGLGPDVELAIELIDVEYSKVDNVVPKLWKSHKPQVK